MQDIERKIKGQPAVFCLSGSSFQALCMIEAIHAFEITDYRVLLCLSENELPRKEQIVILLDRYHIAYEIESINFCITKSERLKAFLPNRNKYKVAFIGDCNNELLIFKACRYVSDGGTLVYLDDGIATIQFFNGMFQLSSKLRPYYELMSRIRRIDFDRYFYTVYEDLEDNRHIPILNGFHSLALQQKVKSTVRGIYIIGTCIKDYCDFECVPIGLFVSTLRSLMHELRIQYPEEPVVYVPHGRETMMEELEKMCHDEGVELRKSEITVEMMLLDEKDYPKSVYGFTSSALYNIKKIFPETETCNITFTGNSPKTNGKEITSQYFAKFGITRRIVKLDMTKNEEDC